MARPELWLTRTSDLFRQAVVCFIANIRVLLVIAALSSVYNSTIENTMGLVGFSYNSTHGNFSIKFDVQTKDHKAKDHNTLNSATSSSQSQGQNLFVNGNNNDIGKGAEAEKISPFPETFASSHFLAQSVEEADGDSKLLSQHTDDGMFANNLAERNGDYLEDSLSTRLVENQVVSDENPRQEIIKQQDKTYLNVRVIYPLKNETEDYFHDDFEESEVTLFRGIRFTGRAVDRQGGIPSQGGDNMLLVLLLLLSVLVSLLVVIALHHSAVLGVVACTVVSTYMNKRVSIRRSVRSGLRTGLWKLIWLALLHGSVRALQSLFLMKFLFGQVLEFEQMQKLVFRLSDMPFSFMAPWKYEYAETLDMSIRVGAFVTFDYLFDALTYCVTIMACWVTIVEHQGRSAETFIRGWNLVKSMPVQVATVKVIESIVCGRTCKWILQEFVGHFAAVLVISFLETFFLVLWLVLYFSARCNETQGQTQQFSFRDLEDFLDRVR